MAGHDGLTLTDFMPGAEPGEDALARAGAPIDPKTTPVASEDAVVEALRSVHDPEIPVNIYDLGLIYGLNISEDGSVDIRMTLTAPACRSEEHTSELQSLMRISNAVFCLKKKNNKHL